MDHRGATGKWFHPGGAYTSTVHEFDLAVGGKYRITMKDGESDASHTCLGEFREIVESERLAFSWGWEGSEPTIETLVTVELCDNGERTDLTLTHTGFPDEETCEHHHKGWTGCIAVLDSQIN